MPLSLSHHCPAHQLPNNHHHCRPYRSPRYFGVVVSPTHIAVSTSVLKLRSPLVAVTGFSCPNLSWAPASCKSCRHGSPAPFRKSGHAGFNLLSLSSHPPSQNVTTSLCLSGPSYGAGSIGLSTDSAWSRADLQREWTVHLLGACPRPACFDSTPLPRNYCCRSIG